MQLTESLPRTPTPLLISRFARLEIGSLGRKIARAFGYRRPPHIALEDIKIPDTQIAKEATEMVEQCSPQFLVNHSIRTYCFGVALAGQLRLKPDLEILYLGAIMHDLGVVSPYDKQPGSFEVNGAKAARDFMIDKGEASSKANLVHEAIALHSAVGIAHKREPEIALVHYGAGIDVIGFRAEDISPKTRETIVAAYPRHQFKKEFTRALDLQVEQKPDCHIAGHCALGFAGKIEGAPFSE